MICISKTTMTHLPLLLLSVIIYTSGPNLCSAAALPLPKFAFKIRRNPAGTAASTKILCNPTSEEALLDDTPSKKKVWKNSRGGAALVKTMTARQMEAFK
jgi:hypothetical protein